MWPLAVLAALDMSTLSGGGVLKLGVGPHCGRGLAGLEPAGRR